jgi:predicted TIM-barrel fold metal-dependent hydrolase
MGMVWIGELCGYIGDYTYDTVAFAAAVGLAAELNMVVQIHNEDVADMARLCAASPDTTFVLSHLGDSPQEVKDRIDLTARFPNLYLDISGHGHQRMGVLELAVQVAGPDRVLFGSDYTINDPAGVIARIEKSALGDEVKGNILGGNLLRLLAEHTQ